MGDPENIGDGITQDVACNDCGANYTELYRLAGLVGE